MPTRRRKPTWTGFLCAAALGVASLSPSALAQGVLPDELVASPQLSGADEQRVESYAKSLAPGLVDGDSGAARDARDAAMDPLERDEVSVAFRIAYAEAMLPTLRRLIAGAEPARRLTGIRLAGELATDNSADLVVASLSSKNAAERYMAVASVGRIFQAAGEQPPAVARNRLDALIDELDRLIRAEPDPAIVDAGVRSLLDASAIPESVLPGVGGHADTVLYAALSERVQNDNEGDEALIVAVTRALSSAQRRILGEGLPKPVVRDSAALAGDGIAMLIRTDATGDSAVEMAGGADALIVFATENLDPRAQANPADLGRALQDGRLAEEAVAVIGPGGALTSPPHNLPAERFAR